MRCACGRACRGSPRASSSRGASRAASACTSNGSRPSRRTAAVVTAPTRWCSEHSAASRGVSPAAPATTPSATGCIGPSGCTARSAAYRSLGHARSAGRSSCRPSDAADRAQPRRRRADRELAVELVERGPGMRARARGGRERGLDRAGRRAAARRGTPRGRPRRARRRAAWLASTPALCAWRSGGKRPSASSSSVADMRHQNRKYRWAIGSSATGCSSISRRRCAPRTCRARPRSRQRVVLRQVGLAARRVSADGDQRGATAPAARRARRRARPARRR